MPVVSGCAAGTPGPAEGVADEKDENVAQSEIERGPVRVLLKVEPAVARLSDEPELTLTIDYQSGVAIQTPPFGESIGQFVIRDFRQPLLRTEGDREILQQIYTLEPTTTGKLAIYPITVTFTDSRAEGDGREHTVQTEGLTVEIASVVDSDVPSLSDLRAALGPVELPQTERSGVWWVVLLLVVIAIGATLSWWLWHIRRRQAVEATMLSPQELAYLELERLLAEDLAATDVKLFYVELTGVVRRYIERTTGIRAPEQTTEEFLREINGTAVFPPDEGQRLADFLESADLVKFAAFEPGREDVEESFRRAKAFIRLDKLEVAA